MNPDRKRRRQEHRRAKRDVLQNDMVLRGWVPVRCGSNYGLMHTTENRLVLRRWRPADNSGQLAANAQHRYQGGWLGAGARRALATPRSAWHYDAMSLGAQHWSVVECSWNEMQAQWMRGLRALVIQKGWL